VPVGKVGLTPDSKVGLGQKLPAWTSARNEAGTEKRARAMRNSLVFMGAGVGSRQSVRVQIPKSSRQKSCRIMPAKSMIRLAGIDQMGLHEGLPIHHSMSKSNKDEKSLYGRSTFKSCG